MTDSFGRRGYDRPHNTVDVRVVQERLDNLIKCQENTVGEVSELRKDIGDIKKQLNDIHIKQARLPIMVEGAKLMLYAILILILLLLLLNGNVQLKELLFKLL